MKVAYIGFDKSIAKTDLVLSKYFKAVDYFIFDTNSEIRQPAFDEMPIIAGDVFIPESESLYTDAHRDLVKKIMPQYQFLKKRIYNNLKIKEKHTVQEKSESVFRDFSEIINIEYDGAQNLYIIENKNQAFYKYNYLIIQNNLFLIEDIQRRFRKVLKKMPMHNFIGVKFTYSIKNKIKSEHLDQDLILIENVNTENIFDNWYIVQLHKNSLDVSFYIPYEQRFSEPYLEFMKERVKSVLTRKFTTFDILNLQDQSLNFSDTLTKQSDIKIYYPKNSCIFPSFTYWSQEKINYYVENHFITKNKNNRNLFEKKEKN